MENGIGMFTSSDTEVIVQVTWLFLLMPFIKCYSWLIQWMTMWVQLLAARPEGQENDGHVDWVARIKNFMGFTLGAYALTIMTKVEIFLSNHHYYLAILLSTVPEASELTWGIMQEALFGVRDPFGFRPLCIGRIENNDNPSKLPIFVLASESCALTTIGAEFVRDVQPGEIVKIDKTGLSSSFARQLPPGKKVCLYSLFLSIFLMLKYTGESADSLVCVRICLFFQARLSARWWQTSSAPGCFPCAWF